MALKRNLTFFICFFSVIVMAQEAYQPGYLVNSKKDTLQGYLIYKDAKTVKYKKDLNANEKMYKASELHAFVIKGSSQKYESHYLSIETAPLKLALLKGYDKNAPATKMDTVLVKALVEGEVSLYQLTEDNGREHFYLRKGKIGNLDELVIRKYYKDINGKKTVATLEKYKGQLKYHLGDCDKLNKTIQKTGYKSSDLQQLVITYLNCKGNTPVQTGKIEKPKLQFGLVTGISHTSINFKSDSESNLASVDFPSALTPVGGLYFNLKFPKKNWRVSLYNELIYKSFSTEGDYTSRSGLGFTTNGNVSIDFSYIRVNTMLRYNYTTSGSLKPFFNFGVANAFALKSDNTEKTELILGNGDINAEEEDALSSVRTYEQGLLLGGGVYKGKLSGEVRFEMSNGISDFAGLSSPVRSIYLIIGYHF